MGRRNYQKALQARVIAPRHCFDSWKEILNEVRRSGHIALFTDFDGTLVRIRRDPDHAVLSAQVRKLLRTIAHSRVTVGVVSGRKLADVRKRVGLAGIWYVGAHGFFLLDPSNRSIALVSPKQRERIRRIGGTLAHFLRGVPGLRLESKGATIAVHYRAASPQGTRLARKVIAGVMARYPGVSLLSGKKVWEILPDSRTDKWAAIRFILGRQSKRIRGQSWLTIFLGDDATDERVFEKMDGISIVVGRKQKTAAHYYLRSPTEVRGFLARLKKAMK